MILFPNQNLSNINNIENTEFTEQESINISIFSQQNYKKRFFHH